MSATKVGAALCLSPFMKPKDVWDESKGRYMRTFYGKVEHYMMRGQHYEPRAMQQYAFCSQRPLIMRNDQFLVSKINPLFGCTLDGMSIHPYDTTDRYPVEMKCPAKLRFPGEHYLKKQNGEYKNLTEKINAQYWIQVQIQMFVTQTPKAHLCFWRPGFSGYEDLDYLSVYEVAYDDSFIEMIVPMLDEFNKRFIQGNEVPTNEWQPKKVRSFVSEYVHSHIAMFTTRVRLPISCDPLDMHDRMIASNVA